MKSGDEGVSGRGKLGCWFFDWRKVSCKFERGLCLDGKLNVMGFEGEE